MKNETLCLQLTSMMKALDKLRDETSSEYFKREGKDIVQRLSDLREVMMF